MASRLFYYTHAAAAHCYPNHPECPDRVHAIEKQLLQLNLEECDQARQMMQLASWGKHCIGGLALLDRLWVLPPLPPLQACRLDAPSRVERSQLAAVHTKQYLDELQSTLSEVAEHTPLRDPEDPDGCTFASPTTWDDAILAASSAVALVDRILSDSPGDASQASQSDSGSSDGGSGAAVCGFSLCRPPGHHATPSQYMGFCLLNNAAIVARHAQRAHGLERVMILDWDVHHGNGTHDIFYDDPSVLFVDLHQAEVWPGTGRIGAVGEEPGEGATINVPLPRHSGHAAVQRAWEAVVVPAARRFRPQLIIVSAGYDAHWSDPLEHLQLQSASYHWLGSQVAGLARELCGGRCLLVLEGGYCQQALAEGVGETLLGLLGRPPATELLDTAALPGGVPEPLEELEEVLKLVREAHGL